MDNSSKVSSLYGPGSIAAWLCTTASVFISWIFNRHSSSSDTIGNDLVASLLLPIIAAIHFQYELGKAERTHAQPAVDSLVTTLCIVLWFSTIAPCLLVIAACRGMLRRWISTAAATLLCASVLLHVPIQLHQTLDFLNGVDTYCSLKSLLGTIILGGLVFFVLFFACYTSFEKRRESLPITRLLIRLVFGISLLVVLPEIVAFFRLPSPTKKDTCTILTPRWGNSLTELDQAVTLGVGLAAVIFSICETLSSRRANAWEKYQDWKGDCEAFIDKGFLNEAERLKWKKDLESMAESEKEVLVAPQSMGLVARMDEIKTKVEKLKVERIAKCLQEGGFL